MNKKVLGYIISSLLIATLIVIMVKSNIKPESLPDVVDENVNPTDAALGFEKGNLAPDFELQTMAGDVVKLSDFRGKKVILNFWASWCGPCKAEMPHMENYYKKNKDSANVEIIAVNLSKTERRGIEQVEKFVEEYGLTFPIPMDLKGEVHDLYPIVGIPTTFFIATDGTIQQRVTMPIDEASLKTLVDNLY